MANKLGTIKILLPEKNIATGSLIFLHGSGDTGQGIRSWIKILIGKEYVFPHLRVLFPTAPLMPYTPMDGEPSNVWFDRKNITPDVAEVLESVDSTAHEITQLIKGEVAAGIPLNRIVVGGFSMGGAMALHMAYRHMPQVAGVFALSSFLNRDSAVYEHLSGDLDARRPPLLMVHGESDTLVPHDWGRHTFEQLEARGVRAEFQRLAYTFHELKQIELLKLHEWIVKCVPEV